MRAKDVMTTPVIPVPPTATLYDVWQLFSEKQISGAPVIDESGRLVGVVSRTDLAREAYASVEQQPNGEYYLGLPPWQQSETAEITNRLKQTEVAKVMNTLVFSVDLNESVRELARVMRKNHLHRLIVTENDDVVGIVTALDLLKAIE